MTQTHPTQPNADPPGDEAIAPAAGAAHAEPAGACEIDLSLQPSYLSGPAAPVSVVILTYNEESNIVDCLASCAWCDDVHVLDSYSTDRTLERVRAAGMAASVHERRFTSFGDHRNWAIDRIDTKHDWVFHLDADERFTEQLVEKMRQRVASDPAEAGFHVPHKFIFMGKWLKRTVGYPTYQMRLFHRERMRFTDHGHGQREQEGRPVGILDEPYMHYGVSKGVDDWIEKHNRYSTLEALEVLSESTRRPPLLSLFSGSRVERRRAWKRLSFHLPLRPHVRWLMTMFVSGGVLEGRAGWTYARLLLLYERMTAMKVRLLKLERGGRITADQARLRPNEYVQETSDHQERSVSSSLLGERKTMATQQDPPVQHARSADAIVHETRPESSPWTLREKVARAVWMTLGKPVFSLSFHNWYRFRAWWLRLFGARIGKGVAIRPSVNIEIPWMLHIDDQAAIGDHAILYSLGEIRIGKRAIVSQYSHLCAGTHDYTDHRFTLVRKGIVIGDDVWIGADAFIGPGVSVGRLGVIGARSSVYRDTPPGKVCVGNPAKPVKDRELR